ncbi:hypothetical protein O3G_MSEX003571 [Manduca sexta]|uniref:Uncharacterized protein n=1 Tax=Manduca sexta TaxID=7130 RepID=A0A921YTK8_MANSE|nr:hypothetical protein O3G_MSEX003571 [Manduca sexta]
MKPGSTTTLQSQNGSQLNGRQPTKGVQSDQKHKCQLARREKGSIANIIWHKWCVRSMKS